ncbi:MAG: MBL fold metallo-hydrolase, partial [Cellvibrionaceae bacterium]|nr:MBL fold metallo-hydrolase [Cellvibrionaceae bacterium]
MSHQICYEDLTAPAPGKLTEVAPGVHWIRMPVPFPPSHINVFLLEDTNGWYIVDTGIGSDETKALWQQITANMFTEKTLLGVIATHLHPDHLGLAGWLCDEWRANFYISQREYLTARTLFKGNHREDDWELMQFYHRCGLSQQQCRDFISSTGGLARISAPLPVCYERLEEGQELWINDRAWRVIIGFGHSPEHACLYCKELNILISGDQILPRISPNISVQSLEPNHSPLSEYLASMKKFYQLPKDCLVLPAHG